jgi:ubiquinol-cytochrome c reductase subunit 7
MLNKWDRYDDLIEEENDIVQEALRRLPPEEQYRRAYRIRIAQQCGVTHTELPKDQWLKAEDVPPHLQSELGLCFASSINN